MEDTAARHLEQDLLRCGQPVDDTHAGARIETEALSKEVLEDGDTDVVRYGSLVQPKRVGQPRNSSGSRKRGPQPWSVDRSVSNPSTSDPDPSNAAACDRSPRRGATTSP